MFNFTLEKTDQNGARAGNFTTDHGSVLTPIFMPVATAAALKALSTDQAEKAGTQILLANCYHLFLQPGTELIKKLGGIHKFMNWHKPILTDSGGYQVFSLPDVVVTDNNVSFKHHKTSEKITLSPIDVINYQQNIGADIIMPLDHCINSRSNYQPAKDAAIRSLRWAEISAKALKSKNQALFGIAQGSLYKDLRKESIRELADLDLPGYALGGLAVGESPAEMNEMLDYAVALMPENKPRYVMGIGTPEDILAAVSAGVDMFDCIIPTKYARSGTLFTYAGKMKIRNSKYRSDKYPIDTTDYINQPHRYSRAYLHHLFAANEILGATIASLHNLHFYFDFIAKIRQSILNGNFNEFKTDFLERYNRNKT